MNAPTLNSPKKRLKFIDMARSIAILMMLEGHFTGAALDWDYRTYDYFFFKVWHLFHGLTSPLFFTVTGLIFVYLLVGKKEVSFAENPRVKKGFRRVGQLLFWGYVIQFDLWTFFKSIYHGGKFYFDWFQAFHVLQSIALGIFLLIIVYRIYSWIKVGPIYLYYLLFGIVIFGFYAIMKEHIIIDKKMLEEGLISAPNYWPKNAPKFIQNMFYGQYSDFSFVRMSGYVMFGGAIGSIVRTYEHNVKKWWFGTIFIALGLLIAIFIRDIFISLDNLFNSINWFEIPWKYNSTSISRFGQVLVLLGILILIDKFFKVKAKLFLKVGQTTFPIYIVHVIILYGGFFGFGLKPLVFDRNIEPFSAILISVIAITFFVLLVKYIQPFEKIYYKTIDFLHLRKKD